MDELIDNAFDNMFADMYVENPFAAAKESEAYQLGKRKNERTNGNTLNRPSPDK